MAPPYQRQGRLWSSSDKSYLIDSIINGFDVPKLYIADFQLGESKLNIERLPYAIIDGKQRLEAIFDFFNGTLTLNDDFVWRADPKLKLGNLSLRDLKGRYPMVAEAFETETVDIMSVVTDDENDINELFVRLNRSKPLTGAEIRNAMVGPIPDIIRSVAKHPFFKENIRFSVSRAGDYNAAAKLILFEAEGRPVNTKKNDLDAFAKQKPTAKSAVELAARRTVDTLDTMQEIFLPRDELLSSAGPIPVYYWLIRNASLKEQPCIREFLLHFEKSRKENRRQGEGKARKEKTSLVRYDLYNRSTNDAASHVGRYEILHEELPNWNQANPNRSRVSFKTLNRR